MIAIKIDDLNIFPDYRIDTIIDRIEFGNDSIRITKKETFFTFNIGLKNWIRFFEIKTYTIKNLQSPYFSDFMQKDTVIEHRINDTGMVYSIYVFKDSSFADSCGIAINHRYSSSYAILSGSYESSTTAYEGLGILGYFRDNTGSYVKKYLETFEFHIRNGVLCGDTGIIKTINNNSIYKLEKTIGHWPNPANNYLYVDIDEAFDYKIYDINGRSILIGNSIDQEPLNIEELYSGIYFVKIQTGIRTFQFKFIKE